jgi:DNA (cytosine-5)-methyltransferase 1
MPKQKPTAIDLFCGCGGLTLGLKKAGFQVLAGIDNDALSMKTYKANHRRTKAYQGDIKEIPPEMLMEELGISEGEIDLIAGCPPCQGFSTLRTLNGKMNIKDPQNDLIFEFLRFVKIMKPKTIMMENVPGLYDDKRLKKFLKEIKREGYKYSFDVRDARHYGVPQRRRRFVLLAIKGKEISLAEQDVRIQTVKAAIGMMPKPESSNDPLHNYKSRRSEKVQRIIAAIPKDGGSRFDLPEELVLPCHKKTNGFKDVYGRMAWSGPSPTITGGCINPSKGRFLHPEENRAITLREAALLQGFPASYKFDLSQGRFPTAQMIGNAFPPKFAEHQARQILSVITGEKA